MSKAKKPKVAPPADNVAVAVTEETEPPEKEEQYEVEQILDMRFDFEKKENSFFVKWKNYKSKFNTWEPQSHLDCPDLLLNFFEARRKRKKELSNDKSKKLSCTKVSGPDEELVIESLRRQFYGREVNVHAVPSQNKFLVVVKPRRDLEERRKAVAQTLKEWEVKLNEICREHDSAGIKVENNVDLAGPPKEFEYINTYQPGQEFIKFPTICIQCECGDECSEDCSCPGNSRVPFAYDSDGLLKISQGPIYECTPLCKCGEHCPNRVIQKGRAVDLCIFRTENGRGWGVRAVRALKKGQFVAEYVGEVITTEAAEKRGTEYDSDSRTYLFDLDFNDGSVDNLYTVDAGRKGNVAHFINHSCEPNLTVFGAWIEHLDPLLPRIALFTNRDIKANEELTFDYKMQHSVDAEEGEGTLAKTPKEVLKAQQIPCRCGAASCRGFLY